MKIFFWVLAFTLLSACSAKEEASRGSAVTTIEGGSLPSYYDATEPFISSLPSPGDSTPVVGDPVVYYFALDDFITEISRLNGEITQAMGEESEDLSSLLLELASALRKVSHLVPAESVYDLHQAFVSATLDMAQSYTVVGESWGTELAEDQLLTLTTQALARTEIFLGLGQDLLEEMSFWDSMDMDREDYITEN